MTKLLDLLLFISIVESLVDNLQWNSSLDGIDDCNLVKLLGFRPLVLSWHFGPSLIMSNIIIVQMT